MKKKQPDRFGINVIVGGVCLFAAVAAFSDEDDKAQAPPNVNRQLLEGLDDLPPLPERRPTNIPGEDIGVAKPTSRLAGLAKLMQDVQQRIRGNDTAAATQQLQSDIAAELERLLEDAEQENSKGSNASSAQQSSEQVGQASEDGTDRGPAANNQTNEPSKSDLLDAAWGKLPDQLRQQIQMPLQEEFLPRYEHIIKQYYKRLAEEQRRLRD